MVIALLAGGALMTVFSPRELMAITGVWEVSLALLAAAVLRGHWRERPAAPASAGGDGVAEPHLGEQHPHVVGGTALWLGILDDLDQGRDDRGVELRPGVGL